MKISRIFVVFTLSLGLAAGCGDRNKPDEPKEETRVERVVMLYAVNHNNLSKDFIVNRDQIAAIVENVATDADRVLIYNYTDASTPAAMFELLAKKGGGYELKEVKQYGVAYTQDKTPHSVSFARMKEVIGDMIARYPDAERTLYFWGHGLGPINPSKYTTAPVNSAPVEEALTGAELYSFGGEYYPDPVRPTINAMQYMDIDSLAMAIPDGKLKTIWFDCCYMGNVEVAYQLRHKCRWMVGYPTEIMGEGLPYNLVLPDVAAAKQNLPAAARSLYDYYNNQNTPVTVGVYDMEQIEQVASMARNVMAESTVKPTTTGLQNYSRMSLRYYDFGQLVQEYIRLNNAENTARRDAMLSEWSKVMKQFVVYSATSSRDFNGMPIDPAKFSGVSCYYYQNAATQRDAYYRRLDFCKSVYKN